MADGQRFEKYPGYDERAKAWRFYYASFRGGAGYIEAADARGNSVLPRHAKETLDGYNWRIQQAVYPNYSRQIVQRYVDAVFGERIKRMDAPKFIQWAKNVDRSGTDFDRYMRLATELSTGLGVYWTAVDARPLDTDSPGKSDMSRNQPYLRRLYPWSIVGMGHDGGVLQWIVEHHLVSTQESAFDRPEERHIFRLWSDREWNEYHAESETGDVALVAEGTHSFQDQNGKPIVPFFCQIHHETEPFHGDGMLIDVAEVNKKIFNYGSLLDEELFKNTITTLWATGTSGEGFDGTKGPDNVYFLEGDNADVKTVGAIPTQAASIRESIQLNVKEIYRLAGLTGGDPTEKKTAESGEAKSRDLEQVYAGCRRVADGAQKTENQILGTVCRHIGVPFEETDYPDTFDMDTLEDELTTALDMTSMSIRSRLAEAEQSKKIYMKMHPKAPNLKAMMDEVDKAAAEPEVVVPPVADNPPEGYEDDESGDQPKE